MAEISATQWQELNPLLDELLEAPAAIRAQRLAQIGRDDEALASQLETLLRQRTAVERDGFLEGEVFTPAKQPPLAGQAIGAYTLERPLGEGGMGAVWLAHRSDGRYKGQVAVKFLNLALLARGGAERFAREGNMLARLTHPNIARLLDAGVAAGATIGGQPYLVLEYIEGLPIDRYCDGEVLPIDRRLHLFLDVLAAVAHAHANLILHRDLKPSNILVTAPGQVKLLDFGIGKLLANQDTAASATELTQVAGHAFTLDYAAPEQVQSGDVTTATDVYALGVLLYQLLAGGHPTALPTQTPVERVRAIIEKEPALASEAAAKADDITVQARATSAPRLARALRGDLDNIVAKALKKQVTERYPTVAALADDLRRYLDDKPVSARADSLAYRASKFVRRYRLIVGASAVVCVTLVAGLAGTLWQAREAAHQRDRALAQLQRAESTADFMSLMIFNAWGVDERLSVRDFLTRSEALALGQFSGQGERQAVVLQSLGAYYASLGENREAERLHRRAKSLLPPTADLSVRATVECSHAVQTALLGDVKPAKADLERWAMHPDVEPQVAVQCDIYLAQIAQTYNDPQGALRHAQRAEKRLLAAPYSPPTLVASLHGDLGFGFAMNDRIAEADRHYDAAIRMYRELNQGESAAVVAILNNWALVSIRAGDYRHALQQLEEVIRIATSRGTGSVPSYAIYNRAFVLLGLGRYEESIAEADRAIAMAKRTSNRNIWFRSLVTKIGAHAELGDVKAAEAVYGDAEALSREMAAGGFDPHLLALRRAKIELVRGQPEEARRKMEEVVAAFPDPQGAGGVLANALQLRAEALDRLGERAAALADIQTALAIAHRLQGGRPHSLRAGQLWLLSARIKRDAGDVAGARADGAKADEHLKIMLDDEHPDRRLARALAAS
ncbi:MAG TPA: protein kinase [Burkholderiaceae bacterium]|nr:protein kinase [Burkholderiaceae bacterium]